MKNKSSNYNNKFFIIKNNNYSQVVKMGYN